MKLIQKMALAFVRTRFRLLTGISKERAAQQAFRMFCTPQERVKVKLGAIFSSAEPLQFQLEGNWVKGFRWNQQGKKTAMILHGFESSVTNFKHYVQPLVDKGYTVLAFDAPANGRSGGKRITAPLYKKMIMEANTKFGPVQSYLAHSFGGLAVALALEEMKHDADYRVVLIAPVTETETAVDNFFSFLHLDPRVRPAFEKVIVRNGGVSTAWYSIRRAMKHIRARVLFFQDEDDDVTPMSDVLALKEQHYPNIEFVFSRGLGHRPIYRDAGVIKRAVNFL